MGPRTSIRGNMELERWPALSVIWLQWGRGLPSAETRQPAHVGVPGVASMGPRTSIRGNVDVRTGSHTIRWLQWGRGLPSVETKLILGQRRVVVRLQWGRGLPSAETGLLGGPTRPGRSASMGPRTSIRGNACHPIVSAFTRSLQWGRGLPSAETWRPALASGRALPASMGPRTSIRGNVPVGADSGAHMMSFNGAADFHPRKLAEAALKAKVDTLQWGRGLPSAETCCARSGISVLVSLQWGRGLPSAETCSS